jgi:hypothetical protein
MEPERLAAAMRGDTRYHGRTCKVCGSTQRYVTSSSCCRCQAERNLRIRRKVATIQHAARVRLADEEQKNAD